MSTLKKAATKTRMEETQKYKIRVSSICVKTVLKNISSH